MVYTLSEIRLISYLSFMLINPAGLKHWLEHFYGYGSWNAKFWFVGYEENTGDLPEEVAEKFNFFIDQHGNANEPTLCNIRELYKRIAFRIEGPRLERFKTFHDHRFGDEPVQHGFWKNLISFEYGYLGKKLPDTLEYQKEKFASPNSQEAWLQFYPLPAHNHAWYYSWLDMPQFPFLRSHLLYEQHIYARRIEGLLKNVAKYQPEVVLMYGMDNINELKKSVQSFFSNANFKTVKAIKNKIPQHHRADFHGTTFLITTQIPGLRHNRIETGFDWLEMGKVVKAGF